jgi:hypothetical protein
LSILAARLIAVHEALEDNDLPHAFGGAIALAYCTEEPRGTRDLDVNVFVDAARASSVLACLPTGVIVGEDDIAAAEKDGQVRVWWEDTPVDVFFDVHEFHRDAAEGARLVPFAGIQIPVLGCNALAVFKILFNRTKDWADVEAMLDVDAIDRQETLGWVVRLLGTDDPRTERIVGLLH